MLDEADQVTHLGFTPQINALLDQVEPSGQRMLFSATLDRDVDRLVHRYLNDPVVHSVDRPQARSRLWSTTCCRSTLRTSTPPPQRSPARNGRVIMFLDTKHAVDQLTLHPLHGGGRAAPLHGGKSQPQRTQTLNQFKAGDVTVLVATNVAARRIHVDDLDLVVNVDRPPTTRTTSTAADAPPAPDSPAASSPSSCPTNAGPWTTSWPTPASSRTSQRSAPAKQN